MGDPITFTPGSELEAAFNAGKAQIITPTVPEGFKPLIVSPANYRIELLAPHKLERPRFLVAMPGFHDVKTFLEYLRDFKNPSTRIFYNQDGKFVAIIDYHEKANSEGAKPVNLARHGEHIAYLNLKRSPEWENWIKNSGEAMGQQAFAEFMEDNTRDLLDPTIEVMMQVATGLHATVGSTFRQAINQSNGATAFQFDTTVNGQVQGANTEVPNKFQVGLRPFMGCCRYPIDCRLRYRVGGGGVQWHYKALHTDPVTELAMDAIVKRITEDAGITPALGNIESGVFAKGQ